MTYRIRPSFNRRACFAVSALPEDNPGLHLGWSGAWIGVPSRYHEPLGSAVNTPVRLRTAAGIKSPADFFGPSVAAVTVSRRFRDIIEDFEPGVHEFHSVELLDHRGAIWQGQYYLMRARPHSALDVRLSDVIWRPKHNDTEFFLSALSDRIVVNRERMVDHHLWQNNPPIDGRLFCSDVLLSRSKSEKIVMIDAIRCIETDDLWDEAAASPPEKS